MIQWSPLSSFLSDILRACAVERSRSVDHPQAKQTLLSCLSRVAPCRNVWKGKAKQDRLYYCSVSDVIKTSGDAIAPCSPWLNTTGGRGSYIATGKQNTVNVCLKCDLWWLSFRISVGGLSGGKRVGCSFKSDLTVQWDYNNSPFDLEEAELSKRR